MTPASDHGLERPTGRRLRGWLLLPIAALVISSSPYVYGYLMQPPGTAFWAVPPFNAEDANQYLAFTRIVAEGQWLVGNPFTAEAHVQRLFLPEAVFGAALTRAFGWSPLTVFQISRVIFGAALLLSAWWLGRLLIARRSVQQLYMAFVCLSAGGGWLVDLLRPGTAHGDEHQPEGNTFYLLGNLPHLILAAALLTALFATRAALGNNRRPADAKMLLGVTVLLSALLSWTHPWDFLSLTFGATAYAAYLFAASRRIPWTSVWHLAAVGAGALPAAIYLSWVISVDPIYATMASDVMQVQRWPFYLVAHGVLAVPAFIVIADRRLRVRYALPICWVLCVFLFLFTPFRLGGKQSRLPGGVHVPLALLAAAGVDRAATIALLSIRRRRPSLLATVSPRSIRRAVSVGCVAVASVGAVAILHRHWTAYAARTPEYFHTASTQKLFEYLGGQARDEVLLGGPLTAGRAPTFADVRTYHGHWHMTLREGEKRAARDWFFTGTATPDERSAWLTANGIRWVIYYPWEWKAAVVALGNVPGLQQVFAGDDIILYRFNPAPVAGRPIGGS